MEQVIYRKAVGLPWKVARPMICSRWTLRELRLMCSKAYIGLSKPM